MQVIGCCLAGHSTLDPTSTQYPRKDEEAPESDIVQAHACHHEQEAVPQYPLVVFMLLLP